MPPANKTVPANRTRHVLFAGWALFLVSLFLPWFELDQNSVALPGWLMVYFAAANLDVLLQLRPADAASHLLGLSAFVHAFVAISPWFYLQLCRGKCQACWIIGAFATTILAIILILGSIAPDSYAFANRIGYFIWCLAVPLVAYGLYIQTRYLQNSVEA